MQFLKEIFYLFFPKNCTICSNTLNKTEEIICTFCRHDLPLFCYKDFKKNKISQSFYGKISLEKAIAFLTYKKDGIAQKLIHELKYKGNEQVGIMLGNWFGNYLKESKEFSDVDYIIPVPLHPKKLKKRGYNQLTLFGKTLAVILQTEYLEEVLKKVSTTTTQTFKQRFERFDDNETKFRLVDENILKNKHVLLIDDVITTGATIEACCLELLKSPQIKISIAAMAYTE